MKTTPPLKQDLQQEQLFYWLALWRAPGIGPKHFAVLVDHYPNLADLFHGNKQQLTELKLPPQTIHYLLNPEWHLIENDWRWGQQAHHAIISRDDYRYPPLLREIASAPPLLFVQGNLDLPCSTQLAMVGSRNPTHTGLENATYFAQQLVDHQFTVTSGLAVGIDAASHQGALQAKGNTIAVMATGLDIIYPRSHKVLAERILQNDGTLLSEFPLGTTPMREHFPRRNRIISGLSLGVLVVEAALKSGSLITARYANEQGREVFSIPGSIRNPLTKGNHELIRQGAKLVDKIDDILEELNYHANDTLTIQTKFNSGKLYAKPLGLRFAEDSMTKCMLLDKPLQNLVNCLSDSATSIELLIERSGITVNILTAMLSELEIAGYIKTVPGGFVRIV